MKKLFFTAISLIFVIFIFCSCEKNTNDSSNNIMPKLVIASDNYEPFFYIDDNNDYAGIDVELAKAACERLGYQPVFKKINWEEKDYLLNSGVVDCLWGSFTMTGRENDYIWAGPYMDSNQVVMVNKNSSINNLSDLDGKKIAVQIGSKPEGIFLDGKGKNIPDVDSVYTFSSIDEIVTALKDGYVDGIAAHESALREYTKNEKNSYKILPQNVLEAQLGVAFSKNGNKILANALSQSLKEMQEDGTIAEIAEKYGYDIKKVVRSDKP